MAYTGIISGKRSSDNGVLAANQKPSIDQTLSRLEPYLTPMLQYLVFSNKKGTEVRAKSGKHSWFETEYLPHQGTVSVAITESSGLTLSASNFSNKAIFKLYDTVYIEETDEQGIVTSITAGGGSDVTIGHIDGSSTLTSLSSVGGYIKIVGSAFLESTTPIISNTTQEVEKYTYVQKFLEGIATTGRDEAGDSWTNGTDHADQVQAKMREMKLMYERAMIYNLTAGRVGSGVTARTWTKGMLGYITTNVTHGYGTLTESIWNTYLKGVLSKGTSHKIHYVGATQLANINELFSAKAALSESVVTKYGYTMKQYFHGQGIVDIVWDPVLDGKFENWGITIDASNLHVQPLYMANDKQGSRRFRLQPNVQTPGADYTQTQLMADIGFMYKQEETAGVLSK